MRKKPLKKSDYIIASSEAYIVISIIYNLLKIYTTGLKRSLPYYIYARYKISLMRFYQITPYIYSSEYQLISYLLKSVPVVYQAGTN